jgi:hypothetical protein
MIVKWATFNEKLLSARPPSGGSSVACFSYVQSGPGRAPTGNGGGSDRNVRALSHSSISSIALSGRNGQFWVQKSPKRLRLPAGKRTYEHIGRIPKGDLSTWPPRSSSELNRLGASAFLTATCVVDG